MTASFFIWRLRRADSICRQWVSRRRHTRILFKSTIILTSFLPQNGVDRRSKQKMDYYPPPIAPLSNTGTNHNDEHHGNYRGTTKRNKRLHCETDRPRLAPEPRVLLYPTLHNTKPERWAAAPVDQYKRTLNTIMPPSPRTPPPSRPPRGLFNSRSQKIVSPPLPHRVTKPKISIPTRSPIIRQNHQSYLRYQRIGPAQVKVFRLQLPMELIHSLDPIVTEAERYAQEVLPNGWNTSLYSLTKQDVAMRDIPGMARRIRPICEYISEAIRTLYGANKVVVDQNQPHILKYSVDSGHTGGK